MNQPCAAATTLATALAASGAPVAGVILHGSAVLGGWTPGRSDLDLLVIVADDIGNADARHLADTLVHFDPAANGMHLEASIVTRCAAAEERDTWPFLAHVNSKYTHTVEAALAPPDASDPDLLMHYAVARVAGRAIVGASPDVLIGPVDRVAILHYLAAELRWGIEHGTAAYALLNACRARQYLADGAIVSKVTGGERCLHDPDAPHAAIAAALAWQRGGPYEALLDTGTRVFIEATARALEQEANDASAGKT